MPTPIALPSCLMDCFKVLFPKLDFSRIEFYLGLPPVVSQSAPNGFTMSSGGPSPDIRIYLKSYEPCSIITFVVIAHELVHAVQIQGMFGGGHIPGSWATYYMSHYLGCGGRGDDRDNALEKEAYEFSNGGSGGQGRLRTFINTQLFGALPCRCNLPWPTPNPIGGQPYADVLRAQPDLVMTESHVGRTWCSLLNWPLSFLAGGYSIFGFSNTGGAWGAGIGAVAGGVLGGILLAALGGLFLGPLGAVLGAALGALIGAYLGAIIGGAIGWFIDNLFSGPSARIWFTAFDGGSWVIPDIPISQEGHTKTSKGPALAMYNGRLYTAYKSANSTDLWYNVFDGTGWLVQDLKITQNGHTRTTEAPALAAFDNKLFLAYKSATSNELWFNVFDGTSWLPQDLKISQGGHTQTSEGPALAQYGGRLYLAYKSANNTDLWYNVFDGTAWLPQDIKITQGGHTKTSAAPALAEYNGNLYLAYRSSSSADIWYNVFDGTAWLPQDIKITQDGRVKTARGPALAVVNPYLVMVYRDDSGGV